MGDKEEKSSDFYAVLGLKKECTALELRNAYKKLALRWHPDRCSASRNSKFVEEAKKKFQDIQEAYSVLSDENKRFLYDVGVYDWEDEDDENGMEDFLGEMAVMMSQTKPCEDGQQSFEELQTLFDEMFHKDMEAFSSTSQNSTSNSSSIDNLSSFSSSDDNINCNNKRDSSILSSEKSKFDFEMESLDLRNICFGVSENLKGDNGRRTGRKQKISSQTDVSSSNGPKISV